MKTVDIKNIKTAKKYSDALFDVSKEYNAVDKIYNELIFVVETVSSNPDLSNFFANPVITSGDKKDVIDKIFSPHCDKVTLDFLKVLADENRLNIINEILNRFSQSYCDLKNIMKPVITSAIELDESQRLRLEEKISNKFNKKVYPQYVTDPDIIGGIIIEAGDTTIDFSIKTKFENMKKQLTKGNEYGND